MHTTDRVFPLYIDFIGNSTLLYLDYNIDPARFIRESVRAEPVEAQPFDKPVLSEVEGLRANGIHA